MEPGTPDQSSVATIPYYISGHYHCAYLWPPGVWFFDHMPIINCIVFGQYGKMVDATLANITADEQTGQTLLIASAFGDLVPKLARKLGRNPLTVLDVAPIQLKLAETKLAREGLLDKVELRQMDAEALEFDDNSFDTALMFLLLNEMPPDARERALKHALRVIRPGGQLIVTEYGALTREHWIHRFAPMRWLVTRVEPWLDSLWREDLAALVQQCARSVGKSAELERRTLIFNGFYRVKQFRVGR
jgi:ubiquinone/menaquinone biosynthesis C-methylase UbiE